MKKIKLHWQILIAMILAILYGIFFKDEVIYVAWMGDIFLRALRMVIIPLILSSIISGVANIGSAENLGRLGLKTFFYYIMTSTIAILTGLILVNIFQPGIGADLGLSQAVEGLTGSKETIWETLKNIIPTNIFQAFVENRMLSVIFFAIVFGFFITQVKPKHSHIMKDFFNSFFEIMMKITLFIIKFTPLGIFGIVAKVVSEQEDLINLLTRMGMYMGVVVLALFIHAFITLPVI
ncbi:MAG: cation:dicarboxylase symporter family transporter, partial [Bacteroidales bacterium]|nr:cation:dicarboxylase symporter family transporter [Bacteroidales bacterium]